MVNKVTAVALAFAVATGALISGTVAAQGGNPLKNIAVSGTAANGGKFTGTFSVERFASQGGRIVAIGRLTGKLEGAPGQAIKDVNNHPARLPVQASTRPAGSGGANNQTAANQECPILHLELGPLDLNLLGLKIHLNQVVLDITAQSGSGNLLGNLLCQIAGLLDGGGPISQIVDLLNRILSALG